ncbi:cache domain-containing sensor histidine kinase [Paenibacillus radicis (ex Gao et al. 2016)]|uniref:histidine kinase n=1 Tax=Paenibacillus radicis (ex Gao et al. 2016) TaxID=1737354 RepID=A0A917LR75_9BACL|nr:sensor histidine kinase [Paenibacillus radicis (ex Gao et al. 2016)]GGG52334.1 histidine kinase [Paenibacillus radicis (ex Gao et al. 2016)]
MNLRPKLMLAFILLILVPMIGLGIVSFLNSETLLEKKYSEQTEISLKAVGGNIKYFFKELEQLSDGNLTSSEVQDTLQYSTLPRDDASTQIAINQAQKEMNRILFQHPAVSYVVLYSNDGTMFRSYRNDPTTFRPITFEQLKQQPLYVETKKLGGRSKWIGPYEERQLTGVEPPLFTQMRLVKDYQTFSDIGLMITQYKTEEVYSMLNTFLNPHAEGRDSRYVIVNQEGLILLDSNKQLEGEQLADFTEGDLQRTNSYSSSRIKFNEIDSLVSAYNLDQSGWVLVSVKSWNRLTNENVRFVQWIGMITVLCVISAILFNVFFVNRVAKSIIKVVRKMRLVEQGLLDIRVKAQGKDETVLLANSFNSMVERIGELLTEVRTEQERKQHAEMMLMQAQIKPHFLFNTLESINALAAQNEGRKIMMMVRQLSNLLRTTLHDSEEIVISQEVAHVRSYLEIQKYRFEDLFTYELNVDEEVYEYTILKLTLQPLVENSIQHGFEGLEDGKGVITIDVRVEAHQIVFLVSDNGVGMSEANLIKFGERSNKSDKRRNAAELGERRGLGLRNVADRLRIHYGPAYGMMICSAEGYGTVIRCTIPKSRGERL